MKKLTAIIIVALMALVAIPAQAQFKYGLKAGVNINSLKFDVKENFDSENRAGFTGGVMAEFIVPAIGIGVDASLLYVHRTNTIINIDANGPIPVDDLDKLGKDYIDIPLNLKYKLTIPVVAKILKPFVTTGPSFAFLVGKNEMKEAFEQKSFDFSWNFGLGVELFSHVQVAANYGLGINKAISTLNITNPTSIKNNQWTISAAYLF